MPQSSNPLGVGMHSYGGQWMAAKSQPAGAKFHDALSFLEYCHNLGAAGVQVSIGARDVDYTKHLRTRAESLGMFVESQATLPRDEADLARFESEVRSAREAGTKVMRTALLSGRRYETFDTAEAFRQFAAQSWKSLTLAEPVVRRHRLRLAVENHKDWLVVELIDLLRRLSSEHVGACVDLGNNLALLEDPVALVESLAPWAATTHVKDMAVAECAQGFLLSEVSLGEGFFDLPPLLRILRRANSEIRFNLEMITRDPLLIPCLTEKYWATFGSRLASDLASALAMVKAKAAPKALPRVAHLSAQEKVELEDRNVRTCLMHARSKWAV